jgi:arylsulfatase A-like enzyme
VGKYLNGYGDDVSPSPNDDPTYIPPGWDDWQALTTADRIFGYTINDNGALAPYGSQPADYQTDVLAARAVDFINESEAADDVQPFLLLVTPQAPHQDLGYLCSLNVGSVAPLAPAPRHSGLTDGLLLPKGPSFNESNVSDKPTWLRNVFPSLTASQTKCLAKAHRNRVGSLLALDDLVGTILAALSAADELDTTLLLFSSDNGFLLGEHRVNSKQQAYEEAIRVPLFVRVPGSTSPQTAQQLVVNVDVAPTLVQLAGASPGITMDGQSFEPILQDPTLGPWRNYVLIEHVKVGGKLVPPNYSAIRSQQHKWVEYQNPQRELYDLSADPFELVSQHTNPAYFSVRAVMTQALSVLKTCTGATCWQ